MAKRGYDHKKWGIVSNYAGEVKFYDKKRYAVEYDPSGEAHFSKRVSKRSKARSVVKDIGFYKNGLLVLIILIALVRFVFMRNFGYSDSFFNTYPNAVDVYGNPINVYYFDVFGFAKYVSQSADLWGKSFKSVVDSFPSTGSDNVILILLNSVIALINFFLAIIKILIALPLQIIGVLFGGPFGQWVSPDGWISSFLTWTIPYADQGWYENWLDGGGGIIINPSPWIGG